MLYLKLCLSEQCYKEVYANNECKKIRLMAAENEDHQNEKAALQ